ncbi:MAG: hypothetical protein K6U74_09140, partial [Firmicutes bacterium]|nr:hypothetical protein [Bacillota bacterium]
MGKYLEIANSVNPEPYDLDQGLAVFNDTISRLNKVYLHGAAQWVQQNRPELWQACLEALDAVRAAFRAKDMAAVRRTTTEFERVNRQLFEAYPGPFWRPGQKGTGGKVWQLTDAQAAELEALFAAPGVVVRKGARWYSPDVW